MNRRIFDISPAIASRGGDAQESCWRPRRHQRQRRRRYPLRPGRADIRLALGGDGEIYVLSKSDGMIRKLVAMAGLAAPGGLAAPSGNAQVTLSWTASFGAAGYDVKRSTTSGGPYTVIAAGVPGLSHTDSGRTNGTRLLVVSAQPGGQSRNASQVSATPAIPR